MNLRKLSKCNRSDELIFRLRKYKSEKSLTYLQLIVAIIEQHKKMKFTIKGRLLPGQPTWVRDYVKLFNLVTAQPKTIRTSPIAKEIW